MDITPLIPEGRQIIQSYGENGFKVNGERYESALIVTPTKTWVWCEKVAINSLTLEDFSTLFETETPSFDVFLFGTGKTCIFPDMKLMQALKEKNIKPDIMDTGAACRTYNVLMAEDRRVAALLLPL